MRLFRLDPSPESATPAAATPPPSSVVRAPQGVPEPVEGTAPATPSVVRRPSSRTSTPPSLTPSQATALDTARAFLDSPSTAFSLTGAAGTGKTTLVERIVDHATAAGRTVHLVAPTARAARVLRRRSGHAATTAHSHLYTVEPLKGRPGFRLHKKPNADPTPTLLVVDEASMVPSRPTSDGDLFHSGSSMLDDLVNHVRAGPRGSQVLFVGDACQLPPVGERASLALDADVLAQRFRLSTAHAELTEIVRQASGSPILAAAHALRAVLDAADEDDALVDLPPLDLPRLRGRGAHVRAYLDASEGGTDPEGSVILAYANRSTQLFNRDVRAMRGLTGDLAVGDLVVLEADAWLTGDAPGTPSLRRGEPYRVRRLGVQTETVAGLRFTRATIERALPAETAGAPATHDTLVLLDALASDRGLSPEQELALYAERKATNATFRLSGHPKDDRYVGALRMRYGYALTVHKAQGGAVDRGVLLADETTTEAALYVGMTRGRDTNTVLVDLDGAISEHQPWSPPADPVEVLTAVMRKDTVERSAIETLRPALGADLLRPGPARPRDDDRRLPGRSALAPTVDDNAHRANRLLRLRQAMDPAFHHRRAVTPANDRVAEVDVGPFP